MPNARELLEQVDALMRRNREEAAVADIPVLTDVVSEQSNDDPQPWDRIADDIRMQVLQRIDIFTDIGLQDQLRARLRPIVDRASAELVESINRHVGELLRSYVAEAIEREIDKWKQGKGTH